MPKKAKRQDQKQDQKQQQWMLRFKVGACYVAVWFIVVVMASRYLPDPMSSAAFFQESHALWFINIGFLVVLAMMLYRIGRPEPEVDCD